MTSEKLRTYNIHVGDSNRRFLRIEIVESYHSLAAPGVADIQEGEHLLRVATPKADLRRAQQLQCDIEQIYELSPDRDIVRNLSVHEQNNPSLTGDLKMLRNRVQEFQKDNQGYYRTK